MSNTCITSWAIKGPSTTVGLVAAAIDDIYNRPRPRPWDRPVLSEAAPLLGIPEDGTPYSEVVLLQRDGSPDLVRLTTEDRGVPPVAFFEALRKRFPDLTVRYLSECFEDDLFETNDREGEHFPERYALDFETSLVPGADPVNYFNSEKDLLDFVEETFGKRYASAGEVSSNLEEDLMEEDGDAFVSLHAAELTDELR